jgi:hypothetical protein
MIENNFLEESHHAVPFYKDLGTQSFKNQVSGSENVDVQRGILSHFSRLTQTYFNHNNIAIFRYSIILIFSS